MAEALYRKYRPQVFEDVIGQDHIERTIKNAIDQDKLSHAYLFCGPRGTGKTTTARLLAKALLCKNGPTSAPDGTCEDCEMIAAGEHPDVYELDAASRTGVENVREEIIGRVQFAPTRGRYKVYIIDEVHMLSTAAFNALLKTLEEPPDHVVFILATTDPQKVPPTIQSRCQRFDFRRIAPEAIVSRLGAICLAEGVEFEGEALDLIAHRAGGGMRNALTSLDQMIAFGGGKVTLEAAEQMLGGIDSSDLAAIVRLIGARDVAGCFRWTSEFVETGADLAQFTRDLAQHVRNLYVMSLAGAEVALEVGEAERLELTRELALFGPDRLARMLCVLGDLSAELKTSTNARLSFEIALTRMVRPDSDLTLEALAERVEALEAGHSAVAHVVSAPAAPDAPAQPAAPLKPLQPIASSKLVPVVPLEPSSTVPADSRPVAAGPAAAGRPAAPAAQPQPIQPAQPSQPARPAQPVRPASSVSSQPGSSARPAQPAPAGAPAVEPAAAPRCSALPEHLLAGLRNPASLQRTWQAALSVLKRNRTAYGVLFMNTKAVLDEPAGRLVIEFPAVNEFAFGAAQKPEVREAVAQSLVQATGEDIPFSYSLGGKLEPAAAAAEPATPAPKVQARAATPEPATTAQRPQAASADSAVAASQPQVAPANPMNQTPRGASTPDNPSARPAAAQATVVARPPVEQRPTAKPTAAREASRGQDAYDDEVVPYDDWDVPDSVQEDPGRFQAPTAAPQPQQRPQPQPQPQPRPAFEQRSAVQSPSAPAPQAAPVPRSQPQATVAGAAPSAADAQADRPTDAWMADFAAGFSDVTFDEVRE